MTERCFEWDREARRFYPSNIRERYDKLKELCLEMGHTIRLMDEDGDYRHLWTQDGEYICDDRWPPCSV